jgi:hypothetical protein
LEACLIAGVVTAAPVLGVWVFELFRALRTGERTGSFTLLMLGVAMACSVIGALVGLLVNSVAGRSRSPLLIGVSAALSLYGGIILGLVVNPGVFHTEWYALPIALIGGAIVGPLMLVLVYRRAGGVALDGDALPELGVGLRRTLRWSAAALVVCIGFAEYRVQEAKQDRVSSSVADARERGVLVRELSMPQKLAYAATLESTPTMVRVEEAWVEKFVNPRYESSAAGEWQRVVVRLRAGEPRRSIWIETDSGGVAALTRLSRAEGADSLLLTQTVRWAPTGPLQFITQRDAIARRDLADSLRLARWRSGTP